MQESTHVGRDLEGIGPPLHSRKAPMLARDLEEIGPPLHSSARKSCLLAMQDSPSELSLFV